MRQITDWTAARSGKTLTVKGQDKATGQATKVTHVLTIVGHSGTVIARTASEAIELV